MDGTELTHFFLYCSDHICAVWINGGCYRDMQQYCDCVDALMRLIVSFDDMLNVCFRLEQVGSASIRR